MVILRASTGQDWTDEDFDPTTDDAAVLIQQAMDTLPLGSRSNPWLDPATGTLIVMVPLICRSPIYLRSGVTLDFLCNRVEVAHRGSFVVARSARRSTLKNVTIWPSGHATWTSPPTDPVGVIHLSMLPGTTAPGTEFLSFENIHILRASDDPTQPIYHDGILIENGGMIDENNKETRGGNSAFNCFTNVTMEGVNHGVYHRHVNRATNWDHAYGFYHVVIRDFAHMITFSYHAESVDVAKDWLFMDVHGYPSARTLSGIHIQGIRLSFSHVGIWGGEEFLEWKVVRAGANSGSATIVITAFSINSLTTTIPTDIQSLYILAPCDWVNQSNYVCD